MDTGDLAIAIVGSGRVIICHFALVDISALRSKVHSESGAKSDLQVRKVKMLRMKHPLWALSAMREGCSAEEDTLDNERCRGHEPSCR